jgi:hypothetical protein
LAICLVRYELRHDQAHAASEDANQEGSIMERAVICYRGEVLKAWEHQDGWTVQLGELEASSRYLDLAVASLVDDGEPVHQLAARLLAELRVQGQVGADDPVAA